MNLAELASRIGIWTSPAWPTRFLWATGPCQGRESCYEFRRALLGPATMNELKNPLVWIAGIALIGALLLLWRNRFTPEARERRRRDRSHRRVVSKSKRPTVKFAVRTDQSGK